MKTIIGIIGFLILVGNNTTVLGQDVIYCKDGSILKAEIEKIDTVNVYYYLYPRNAYPDLNQRTLVSIDSFSFGTSSPNAIAMTKYSEISTRHAFSGELSGSMIGVGVGYSGILSGNKKTLLTGGLGVGVSFFSSVTTKAEFSVCFSEVKNGVTGHYFEMGMMGCWLPGAPDTNGTFTPLFLGYRYQPPKAGVFFRVNGGVMIGALPGYVAALPTFNLSIGGAF